MWEALFTKYLIHFWLVPLVVSLKILRNKEIRQLMVSEKYNRPDTPKLDSAIEGFFKKRRFDHLKYLMEKKEIKEGLSTGKMGVGSSRLDPDYISSISEIYWLLIILLTIFYYLGAKYITEYLFQFLGHVPVSMFGGTYLEISFPSDGLTYFIAPVVSIFLPAPTLCLISCKVIPYLFKKRVVSGSFFYGCAQHYPMAYPFIRNICLLIGVGTYFLYFCSNFQCTYYGKDEIIVDKILQRDVLHFHELTSFKVSKSGEKVSQIDLSFGEKGYVKILQSNSSYLNYEYIKIERDFMKDLIFNRLRVFAKEIDTKKQFDLRTGKEEYNTEKLYFEDYLSRIFLTLFLNTIFFIFYIFSGSWISELLGFNKP